MPPSETPPELGGGEPAAAGRGAVRLAVPLRAFWQLLAGYLRPQWARVAILAAVLFMAIGLQLWAPQLLRRFIDRAMAGEATDRLVRLAVIFIGIALVTQVLLAFAKYLGEQIGWT